MLAILKDFTEEYARYRAIGENAMRQVSDDELNHVIGPDNNSIAMIVRHIGGNLLSRFTDFLTTDGEKPWRNRDSEFEDKKYEKEDVERMWIDGWGVLEAQLSQLSDEHLGHRVYIRGQAWTVHGALCRSLAHVSYHVGQIVLLARILNDGNWVSLSIPRVGRATTTRTQQSKRNRSNDPMKRKLLSGITALSLVAASAISVVSQTTQQLPPFPPPKKEPAIVTPGNTSGEPPSDALVLFDGKDLSKWRAASGKGDAKWKVQSGFMEVAPGAGDIATRQEFADCQLHIEWATPSEVKGEGQERGNSGVFLMERYEVQVLDSFENKTYFHGQAGSIYNQYAPLVNASRKPGEWQSYDIIFKAPKFDEQGKVTERARITVLHNGVLIQNNVEIYGNTWHDRAANYIAHGPASLRLQDHGNPIRYRNVWIRPL